jgi:hypothetical protein
MNLKKIANANHELADVIKSRINEFRILIYGSISIRIKS